MQYLWYWSLMTMAMTTTMAAMTPPTDLALSVDFRPMSLMHCLLWIIRTQHTHIGAMLPPGQAAKLPRCGCSPEWFCKPHNACFIYESCFCEGSGAYPSFKPVRSYWCRFFQDFLAELLSWCHSSSYSLCFGSAGDHLLLPPPLLFSSVIILGLYCLT